MSSDIIAIIDDDDSFRVALVESLLSLGYRADGFRSGEEFIGAADEPSYVCIVTDIHMPGTSGLELAERLAERGSATPIVLITARSDASLPAKARAAGAVCLLTKPFDTEDLIRCIEAAAKPPPV